VADSNLANEIDAILALVPTEVEVNDTLRYYGKHVLVEKLALARTKLEELKSKSKVDR
jgi:hypothetical protein